MRFRLISLLSLAALLAGALAAQTLIGFKPAGGGQDVPVDPNNPLPVTIAASTTTATPVTFVRGFKIPASTGTPEALAVDGTYVTTVTIWGIKAARSNNTGTVYLDSTSTNDAQAVPIGTGSYVTLTASPGKLIDLNDLYLDSVTSGDGVFYLGMK